MFILATAEIVLNCVVIFDAFIEIAPGPNPRAVRKLKMDNLHNPLVLAKKAIFITTMIAGDVIVVGLRLSKICIRLVDCSGSPRFTVAGLSGERIGMSLSCLLSVALPAPVSPGAQILSTTPS